MVLYNTGLDQLFVGSSDGRLYQIDVSGVSPTTTSVPLGDGSAAVGAPSLDVANNLLYVGTDAGIIYAVAPPIP